MRFFKGFSGCRVLLFLAVVFSCISYGETKVFLAKDIHSIKVEGVKMKVVFKYRASKNFQIEWKKDSFSIKIKKAILEIKDPSYQSKSSWVSSNLFSKKEMTLKIIGPSKPVSIFAADVNGYFTKWKSPVFISATHKSKVSGNQNSSSWNLFSKDLNLNLNRHTGPIHFRGFSLKAKLQKISKTKSYFYFNDGLLKMTEGSGDIFFTTDRAKIDIKKFEGNLVGTTQSGSVNVSVKIDKKIDIFSKEGDLRFYFRETGPRFFAYTERGKIYAPNYMYKEYSGKSLKVTGRMNKNKKQGRVSLKTDVGSIYAY